MRSLREALNVRDKIVKLFFVSPDAATFQHPPEGTLGLSDCIKIRDDKLETFVHQHASLLCTSFLENYILVASS